MDFAITDFLIGFLFMNAMAHFVIGITKIRFLGLFGYSPKGNIAYAVLQFVVGLGLCLFTYDIASILSNGILLGSLFILITYFITGHFFVRLFHK